MTPAGTGQEAVAASRASLRQHVGRLVSSEAAQGAALSLGLKVGGSALNILMLTLIARSMNGHEFGIFALWFNALSFLAVVAGCGQEKLILRSWSEYMASRDWGLALGAILFGSRVSVAGSLILALGIVAAGWLMGSDPRLVAAAAVFLVALTLFLFSAHVNRAVIGILSGDMHDMTWRLIVVAGAGAALLSQRELAAHEAIMLAGLGTATGLAFQTVTAWRRLPRRVKSASPRSESGAWLRRSLHMAAGGVLEGASQFLEVLVVGLALSPTAAGGYFVASRLANVFFMITGGFNSYATRQIPRQHFGVGRDAIAGTLRYLAAITSVLVLCAAVSMIVFGRDILSLFGSGFTDQYVNLIVLSAGTALVALMGPAPAILLFTGHERTYSLLIGTGIAIRLGALLVMAFVFGSTGAAAASAVAATAVSVTLNLACRRLCGLNPAVTSLLPAWRVRP